MKAGIDFGSSLVKAAWQTKDEMKYFSTANTKLEEIVKQLSNDGIRQVNVAGIGCSDSHAEYFKNFEINEVKGNPITQEKKLQVKGAKELMKDHGLNFKNFVLTSIGTGTSYTLRLCGFTIPVLLGNSLSGGFLGGIGKHLGIEDYHEMSRMASKGTPLNVYVKDKLPGLDGIVVGEYVVAHLAKADKNSTPEDILATAIDIVGATTIKDLALLSHSSKFFKWTKDIVYIGSTVSGFPVLRESLTKYTRLLGKEPHFLEKGEYALALGALHTDFP